MSASVLHYYRNSVALLCVIAALVLVLVFVLFSYFERYASAEQLLVTQAKMVAVALGREDDVSREDSKPILQMLSANPSLVRACALGNNGVMVDYSGASYKKGMEPQLRCETLMREQSVAGKMVAIIPIVQASFAKEIGKLVLVSEPPALTDSLLELIPLAIILALLFAAFCWALGARFWRILLKPMRQISSTAQRVSLYKDYSLRVVAGTLATVPQEVESLTDSFNAMLKEIEDRDSRLSRKSAELDRARQTAESANLAKSQFLANVSHELRTPLNAIIGFSAMLSDEQFGPLGNPKYVEYAKDIQDSGKHLLDVINDILDLTKAEAGKLSVSFKSLALPKIIEKSMRIIAGHAHQRKIDIYTDLPSKLPKIIADPVRLVQILLNLLSNAIKFSPEGGQVVVRASAEPARQGVFYFTLTVEDKGIGMSEEAIHKAFSTFNQADMGLNRKYEGAGLGLPLTKKLVELHHGKIKIESKVGSGTIVTVRLTSDPALLD